MKKNNIKTAISSFLVLLLCLGVVGLFFSFTNGFTEDFKTFYLTYNGKDIFATKSKMYFVSGEEHCFDVTYTFEFLDEDEEMNTDYSVKIIPNRDKNVDFSFTMDGKDYAFSDVEELTNGFKIDKQEKSFSIFIPEDLTMEKILENVYGKDVTLLSDKNFSTLYLYTLVVTSYDESVTYYIDFGFGESATGLQLDVSEVIY